MNKNGPHRLIRSASLKFGLHGVGVVLLEEVCHRGWASRFQKLKPGLV